MISRTQTNFTPVKNCPQDYAAKLRTPGCRLEQSNFIPMYKPKPRPTPTPPSPSPSPPTPEPPVAPYIPSNIYKFDFGPILAGGIGGGILGGVGTAVGQNLLADGFTALATEESAIEMTDLAVDSILFQGGTEGEAALLDEAIVEGAIPEAFTFGGEGIELADLSLFAFEGGELATVTGAEAIAAASLAGITAEAGIIGASAVAAETTADIAAAELAALPLDFETFGGASLAALGIGTAIGAAAGAGILAAVIPQFIKDNPQKASSTLMNRDQVNNSISVLEKSGDSPQILKMLKENKAADRPVYNIYQDDGKNLLVGLNSPEVLGKYIQQYRKNKQYFVGFDPAVLEAMGLNPNLATGKSIRASESEFSKYLTYAQLPTANQILGTTNTSSVSSMPSVPEPPKVEEPPLPVDKPDSVQATLS
jgi:hypothetical protein